MADGVRQRKPQAEKSEAKRSKRSNANGEIDGSWKLDILRVASFLFFASCGLSYIISGGESYFWGMKNKPNYLRVDWWKSQFTGPVYLTPIELAAFDGKDETKPLYLSINGTIYDVSKGRHMYGPGGSYSIFAGRDASRAFVTGCFREDLTSDMRGVEEMYLPIDDAKNDAQWTSAEIAQMKVDELITAKQRAYDSLKHWVDFFANSPKYTKVGYLKREEGWLEKQPKLPLCKRVQDGRKKRISRKTG